MSKGYQLNERLEELIGVLSIDKLIIVDDDFDAEELDDGFGSNAVVNAFREARGDREKLEAVRELGIDQHLEVFGLEGELESDEILVDAISKAWGEVSEHLKRQFFEIMGMPDTRLNTFEKFRALSEDVLPNLNVVKYSVANWITERDGVYADDARGSRIIVLFDLSLKYADPEALGTTVYSKGGLELVKHALDNGGERVIPGIVTGEVRMGAAELKQADEQFARGVFAGAISKDRLEKDKDMAKGLEMIVAANYLFEVKSIASSVFENQATSPEVKSGNIGLRALLWMERQVAEEGLHVSASILRIIRSRHSEATEVCIRARCAESKKLAAMDALDITNEGVLKSFHVNDSDDLDKKLPLRQNDVYISGKTLSELQSPTTLGDVYAVEGYGSQPNAYYVLLNQPCNLSIRSNGVRNIGPEGFTLVKLVADRKQKEERFSQELPPPLDDCGIGSECSLGSSSACYADFNEYRVVPQLPIDLCVFNVEGKAESFSCENGLTPIEKGWKIRGKQLLDELEGKRKEYNALIGAVGETENAELAQAILSSVYSLPFKQWSISADSSGAVRFGIRRVARLREAYAQGLLMGFARYQSRAAYPNNVV